MPGKNTYFKEQWLDDAQYSVWLVKGKSKKEFGCKLCNLSRPLQLGNMGERALKDHEMGQNHMKSLEAWQAQLSVATFLDASAAGSSVSQPTASTPDLPVPVGVFDKSQLSDGTENDGVCCDSLHATNICPAWFAERKNRLRKLLDLINVDDKWVSDTKADLSQLFYFGENQLLHADGGNVNEMRAQNVVLSQQLVKSEERNLKLQESLQHAEERYEALQREYYEVTILVEKLMSNEPKQPEAEINGDLEFMEEAAFSVDNSVTQDPLLDAEIIKHIKQEIQDDDLHDDQTNNLAAQINELSYVNTTASSAYNNSNNNNSIHSEFLNCKDPVFLSSCLTTGSITGLAGPISTEVEGNSGSGGNNSVERFLTSQLQQHHQQQEHILFDHGRQKVQSASSAAPSRKRPRPATQGRVALAAPQSKAASFDLKPPSYQGKRCQVGPLMDNVSSVLAEAIQAPGNVLTASFLRQYGQVPVVRSLATARINSILATAQFLSEVTDTDAGHVRSGHGPRFFMKKPPSEVDPLVLQQYGVTLEQYAGKYNETPSGSAPRSRPPLSVKLTYL